MKIAKISLLLGMLCLLGLNMRAQKDKIVFKDIRIVPTEEQGLQGIGIGGEIFAKDENGRNTSVMHKEVGIHVYDAAGHLLAENSKSRPRGEWESMSLFPNTQEMEKRRSHWLGGENVKFFSFAELGLREGEHDLKVELEVSDVFEPEEEASEQFSAKVKVPLTTKVFVRMWEKSRGDNWPNEGIWFFQGADQNNFSDPNQPQGWLNWVQGDLLQMGVLGEEQGHTSGFRLFGIQFSQGRSYTYQGVAMATAWSLDTALQSGYQKGEIILPNPGGDNDNIAGFEAYTWDYFLKNRSPFHPGTETKPRLGNGEFSFARSTDSAFVIVPMDCSNPDVGSAFHVHAQLSLHGAGNTQTHQFYYTCGIPVYSEYYLDGDFGSYTDYLDGARNGFDVGSSVDGAQEYWVFSISMKDMARRLEIDNLPGDSLFLDVSLLAGEGVGEPVANLFSVQFSQSLWDEWKQIRTTRTVIWTAVGIGIVLLIAFGIIAMVRKSRRERLTNIRIG